MAIEPEQAPRLLEAALNQVIKELRPTAAKSQQSVFALHDNIQIDDGDQQFHALSLTLVSESQEEIQELSRALDRVGNWRERAE